jgi:hypothetical protein
MPAVALRWVAAASLLAPAVAGCFQVTARLAADGSGTLTLRYFPPRHATVRSETQRLGSDHVTVRSLRVVDHRTEADLAFDDLAKLPTAEAFRDVTVERTREGEATRLRIGIPVPRLPDLPEEKGEPRSPEQSHLEPRISLALPGEVVRAEPQADIGAGRVAWHVPLQTFRRLSVLELSVLYVTPPAPDPAAPPADVSARPHSM